jgi:uncharacterized protein (TIGR02594 family)
MSYKSDFANDSGWNAIDTNHKLNTSRASNFVKYLEENNVKVIIRYYASSKRSKTISLEEYKFLSNKGFLILPVYQDINRKSTDFGYNNGIQHAKNALEFTKYLSQPEHTTILFAVDTDFTPEQIEKYIVPYFQGINEIIKNYQIGAYGSGAVLDTLYEKDLIDVRWISMSRLFYGTENTFYSNAWDMRQLPPDHIYDGINYDVNIIKKDIDTIGAFKYNDSVEKKETYLKKFSLLQILFTTLKNLLTLLFSSQKDVKLKTETESDIEGLPWMTTAINLIGTKEIPGRVHNKKILGWAKNIGGWIKNFYTNDEIPWCGLFVAHCMREADIPLEISNPLSAREWLKFGERVKPAYGAVIVFSRKGGGHVGFYVSEDTNYYHILGGNQSNQVNVTKIAKSRFLGAVWPKTYQSDYIHKRVVKKFDGKVSTDEA